MGIGGRRIMLLHWTFWLVAETTSFRILDTQDEVLTGYIESQSPVNITLASRIMNANGTVSTQPTGTGSPSTPTESAAPTEMPSSGRLSREGVSSVVAISALVLG